MLAVSGDNAEAPLAVGMNATLLHQPFHPKLAHAHALRPQ